MYYGVMLLLDMEIISNLVLTNSHSSDLCYLRDWRVVVSVSEAFGLVFIWLELLMVCGFVPCCHRVRFLFLCFLFYYSLLFPLETVLYARLCALSLCFFSYADLVWIDSVG
uniref:Uncharacterized protein n=1 Tax=Cannabis sativa TaxID=3483 RepID=A0A803R9S2_CANSA